MRFALNPISAGLLLSYRCSSECGHCMYACSPKWTADWISEDILERILLRLSRTLKSCPGRLRIDCGLHFTGGEPFLNVKLLVRASDLARKAGIRSTFVETNCLFCSDDAKTEETLVQLKRAGLEGILISVNPFVAGEVPFERTERAVRVSRDIFGPNAIVYQDIFYQELRALDLKGTLPLEDYLKKAPYGLGFAELLPMGRAVYRLGHLFRAFPARYFFGQSCREELLREWHVHIDNYGNYVPGYCAGISLGNWLEADEVDLEGVPVVDALVRHGVKGLYEIGLEFGYECKEGYISKCHLCVDLRKYLVKQTSQFKELEPRQFYTHLE